LRTSEWLAVFYFFTLAAAAVVRRLPVVRRAAILIATLAVPTVILVIARDAPGLVRDWAPALLILIGYYISGWFFVAPSRRFEQWLIDWDHRVLGDPTRRFVSWPRLLLAYLEVVYVGCFLLVPAGFAALALTGRAALADRFWTMVAAAEFGSFISLTVVQARPPWLVERTAALRDRAIHRAALRFVEGFTIRVNTFPSGHAAGSLAVALALIGPMPLLGSIFLALAVTISVACVVGRYHYVADVVAGAALAIVIWALAR
jgi:membrane-associated phospholipid phosphatase